MSKPEWGTKRICPSCGLKYYDLRRDPIVCPQCGTEFDPDAVLRSRRPKPVPKEVVKKEPKPVEGAPAEEAEQLEEAEFDAGLGGDEEAEEDAIIEDASELDDEDGMSDVVLDEDEEGRDL